MSTNMQIFYPELLTRGQRVRDTFMTALMWCIYVYLWMPLVSLLAWLAGLEFAYDVMVRAGGAVALLSVLAWYAAVVSVIFVVVTVWSVSNRLRFRNRDGRRRGAGSPVDQTLAEYFGLGLDQLDLMRRNRIMMLEFDQGGRPIWSDNSPETTGVWTQRGSLRPPPTKEGFQHALSESTNSASRAPKSSA